MKNTILVASLGTLLVLTVFISTPANAIGLLPTTATPITTERAGADVLVEQARLLNRANRLTAALFLLDQVIIDPSSNDIALYRAYFLRGQISQAQAEYESAIRDYDNAIALQPSLSEVYAYRATAFFALQDYDAAIADYDAAILYDESEPNYYLARGIIRVQLGDYAEAIDDFSLALAFDAELAIAYRERGLAAYTSNRLPLAITDLQQYLRLAPDAPDRNQIEAILVDLE